MKTLYANEFVQLEVPTGNGQTKTVREPLFKFWLEHPDRPTAIGVTMDPTAPDLWTASSTSGAGSESRRTSPTGHCSGDTSST